MGVQMTLDKVWDALAERRWVGKGGVWPVEASCVLVEGEERWVLDELPAELSGAQRAGLHVAVGARCGLG